MESNILMVENVSLMTSDDVKRFAEFIKNKGNVSMVSIYYKDGEYRGRLGYDIEEFYEECDSYIKLFLVNHKELKNYNPYRRHENFYKENNVDYSFTKLFTTSYNDYYEELYEEVGMPSDDTPNMHFNYIIRSTNLELTEDFNIASINFIASNRTNIGLGTEMMNVSLELLRCIGVEKVIIQLLKPSLRKFYSKFGYIELKNINKKEGKELVFMEKVL